MKFMKLGTRPDTFFTCESVRSVSTEVATDLQIQVDNCLYHLHKFPLLSKCLRLQALCAEPGSGDGGVIELRGFPGCAEAFEACAKFCYGITITVGAHNVVPLRCAAAYLGMTEAADRGNLAAKLDAFLASCLVRRWKDVLTVLHSTRRYAPLCEELGITPRCVDAVAALITNPSAAPSPTTALQDKSSWWAHDIAELGIDLYWRIMVAVKATGTVQEKTVGDALKACARRWLPNVAKDGHRMDQPDDDAGDRDGDASNVKRVTTRHRLLLEKIVSLLPSEKNAVSCSFLLKLLKAANILSASLASKEELARRAALQLEEANLSDLLIPAASCVSETLYDVDAVMAILEEFALRQAAAGSPNASPARAGAHRRSRSAESAEFEAARRSSSAAAAVSHATMVKVGKLVDGFLVEAAKDANLPLEKLLAIAAAVPECARPDHDDLYRVVDTYLRAHPKMDKNSRKRLCRVINCRKLSEKASMHAAQNELLPLRVVVQVLFFEHARAAALSGNHAADLPGDIKALLAKSRPEDGEDKDDRRLRGLAGVPPEDDWSVEGLKRAASRIATLRMKLEEDEDGDDDDEQFVHRARGGLARSASSRLRAFCAIPAGKPKRMLSKLWPRSRGVH